MPVPSLITDLSTTAGSNSPSGSETPAEGDNYIRSLSSFIAQLRDKSNGTSDSGVIKNATFSGTMVGTSSWSSLQVFLAGISSTTGSFSGSITAANHIGAQYTPTLTAVTNVTTATPTVFQYMRVGSVVTVSGQITIDPATNGNLVEVGISLPVASDFANLAQCSGAAHGTDGSDAGRSGGIFADVTNNRASLQWIEVNGAASNLWVVHFTYYIV